MGDNSKELQVILKAMGLAEYSFRLTMNIR